MGTIRTKVKVLIKNEAHLSTSHATVAFRVADDVVMFLIPEKFNTETKQRELTNESFSFFAKQFRKWLDFYEDNLNKDNVIQFVKDYFEFQVNVQVNIPEGSTNNKIYSSILNEYENYASN